MPRRAQALARPGPPPGTAPHAIDAAEVLRLLGTTELGLASTEVTERLRRVGRNELPRAHPTPLAVVFLRQFLSPLIYVLLGAAAVSIAIGHAADSLFIGAVLLLNAAIGTAQEVGAQRSAATLQALAAARARVLRDGVETEVDAAALVPGDVVTVEGGYRVPADLRVLTAAALETDESLLTGESVPVAKRAAPPVAADAVIADRACMLFAGTLVSKGRAVGVVVSTGLGTELGRIASAVERAPPAKPPLLVRMDRLARWLAVAVGVAATTLAAVTFARGAAAGEVFLFAVALAVSAIPEGLPVALTIALAIGARRMARRNVIARRLVAVESLGSCTFIASDKTGTLTMNELTVRAIRLPGEAPWPVTGEGLVPAGGVVGPDGPPEARRVERLCTAAALCNDATLTRADGRWLHHGDAVDVALLVLAQKMGIARSTAEALRPRVAELPFEAERRFSATLHAGPRGHEIFVKGAVERVLPMCSYVPAPAGTGDEAIDPAAIGAAAEDLAAHGFRVLALAAGTTGRPGLSDEDLVGLTLLGLVAMIDPLRSGAADSIAACRAAGLEVAMVTGDHPVTALAIARELGLAEEPHEVVTGAGLAEAAKAGADAIDAVVRRGRVFARVDPTQKLDVVSSLRRLGHFVAVTGDGANDAPALRAAHVGVAMGRRGTDVARENADLVLADDDFTSIVAGVEEGRVAYANVRKVTFLLVSTGAAEIVLFGLAVATGMPLPLLPVQLLWLNLVTNGIQDVALAFEPAEGGEMGRPPRPPSEPIFERVMLTRTVVSAAAMGVMAFAAFWLVLRLGWPVDRGRNFVLLAMVLFENVQAGNSRSETLPVVRLAPLRNPLLLFGTLGALALHVTALYAAPLAGVLRTSPANIAEWAVAGLAAMALAGVADLEKSLRRRRACDPLRRRLASD